MYTVNFKNYNVDFNDDGLCVYTASGEKLGIFTGKCIRDSYMQGFDYDICDVGDNFVIGMHDLQLLKEIESKLNIKIITYNDNKKIEATCEGFKVVF